MNSIKIMSESLANKIAAGEVVESVSAVVKELVENSIDAKAKNIKIELFDSGLKKIKVTDDGKGMSREDAALAFCRHATSKLLNEDDLAFINTLGFRGEALPSIAAVSLVTLITCATDIGTKIVIDGGKIKETSNSEARVGTSIEVSNLFYNTPARLKYLKSEIAELAKTITFTEKIALSHPDISFSLINNNKSLLSTSGSNNLLKCIHEIYGLSISNKMLEIKGETVDFSIFGYICKPEVLKSNRNHLITIVNGRVVKNNDLNRFINDAYYTYKPQNKYPIAIININTDATLIDVNVHPTKQDIKISKINLLEALISDSIKDALFKTLLIPELNTTPFRAEDKEEEPTLIKESQTSFDFYEPDSREDAKITTTIKNLVLYPVGLVHGTYIVCENEEGMYLIDQHAAAERVNYEKYLQALDTKKINTTTTLIPITIELSPSEYLIIKDNLESLENIGLILKDFGINTFVVEEHPTWLLTGYEEESIKKILDLVIINKKDFNIVKFRENIAITLACKLSIKANMSISREAMEEIISSLVKCTNPYNCPHGRPTIIKFTTYELEKMFKRAG